MFITAFTSARHLSLSWAANTAYKISLTLNVGMSNSLKVSVSWKLWKSKSGADPVFVFDTLGYWNMLCRNKMFDTGLYCEKTQIPYPESKITYNILYDSHKTKGQPLKSTLPSGCTVHTFCTASNQTQFLRTSLTRPNRAAEYFMLKHILNNTKRLICRWYVIN
jgi:hypothetical protein